MQEQEREQGSLLGAAHLKRPVVVTDLQRSEKPKFHSSSGWMLLSEQINPFFTARHRVRFPAGPMLLDSRSHGAVARKEER